MTLTRSHPVYGVQSGETLKYIPMENWRFRVGGRDSKDGGGGTGSSPSDMLQFFFIAVTYRFDPSSLASTLYSSPL